MFRQHECRAFLTRLREEHQALQNIVHDIQNKFLRTESSSGQFDTATDFIDRLDDLREKLQQHFTEEETGGCIDEAVSRRPSLSSMARESEMASNPLSVSVSAGEGVVGGW